MNAPLPFTDPEIDLSEERYQAWMIAYGVLHQVAEALIDGTPVHYAIPRRSAEFDAIVGSALTRLSLAYRPDKDFPAHGVRGQKRIPSGPSAEDSTTERKSK